MSRQTEPAFGREPELDALRKHERFLRQVHGLAPRSNYLFVNLVQDPGYHCVAEWLYPMAIQADLEDRTRRLAPNSRAPVDSTPRTTTTGSLATWLVGEFKLEHTGALARLQACRDQDVSTATSLLLYEGILRVVRRKYAHRHGVEVTDLAHEIFCTKQEFFASRYDPRQAALSTFLYAQIKDKSLRMNAREIVGTAPAARRWDELPDTDQGPAVRDVVGDLITRLALEADLPPRDQWPVSVRLQYDRDLAPKAVAEVTGRRGSTLRAEVKRFLAHCRRLIQPGDA